MREYLIIFKWYYDNNPNDFILMIFDHAESTIYANLNRLDQKSEYNFLIIYLS